MMFAKAAVPEIELELELGEITHNPISRGSEFDVIPPYLEVNDGSILPTIKVTPIQDHFDNTRSQTVRKNSRVFSVFLLLNSMIGSGIFNIPHVFSKTGLLSAFGLLTVSAFLVYQGLVILVQVSEHHPELDDYSALARKVFEHNASPNSKMGFYASKTTDFFIMLIGFGSLLSYLSGILSMVHELLQSWSYPTSKQDGVVYAVASALVLFIVFPLCVQRFYGHFSSISVVSMLSVGAVLLLVVIGGPLYASLYSAGKDLRPVLSLGNPVAQIGSVIFTFSCASATFHTYRYMEVKSAQEWKNVAGLTVIIAWCMCVAMGTGGYLSFGDDTDGIILANFRRGHVGDAFQVLFIVHLVLYIPLDFLVARHSLMRICGSASGAFEDNRHHIAFTLVLLCGFTFIIFLMYDWGIGTGDVFSTILNFTGGLGGSVVSFVLPSALWIRQRYQSWHWYQILPCAIMFGIGILISIYVPVLTVLDSIPSRSS